MSVSRLNLVLLLPLALPFMLTGDVVRPADRQASSTPRSPSALPRAACDVLKSLLTRDALPSSRFVLLRCQYTRRMELAPCDDIVLVGGGLTVHLAIEPAAARRQPAVTTRVDLRYFRRWAHFDPTMRSFGPPGGSAGEEVDSTTASRLRTEGGDVQEIVTREARVTIAAPARLASNEARLRAGLLDALFSVDCELEGEARIPGDSLTLLRALFEAQMQPVQQSRTPDGASSADAARTTRGRWRAAATALVA